MIQELLIKLGIPTYCYSIKTLLPAAAIAKNTLGDTLQEGVGLIYGLSVNVSGVDADNGAVNNILGTEAFNLFLTLKYGQSIYIDAIRLNHFVFDDPAAAPKYNNPEKFFRCNIPGGTDFKQSYYSNPAAVVSKQITLNLFYIDITSYNYLLESGQMLVNGKRASPAK